MLRHLLTGLTFCAAFTVSATPAASRITTGNDLLRVCETSVSDTDGPENQLRCTVFVGDIVFGRDWRALISIEDADGKKCIPEGVNVGQLKDISLKYLRDNPIVRHELAEGLVLRSILEAFPNCKVRWLK